MVLEYLQIKELKKEVVSPWGFSDFLPVYENYVNENPCNSTCKEKSLL